jgi:hypothetical protein
LPEIKQARQRPLINEVLTVTDAAKIGGTQIPQAFLTKQPDPTVVDQFHLDAEVYIHEGVELLAESLNVQLGIIPEGIATNPDPVDIAESDIGEEENTPEEIAQMRKILEQKIIAI